MGITKSQNMEKKLKPKEVRIVSDTGWLDVEELEGTPAFGFKIPSPVKTDEGIQVVGPTKKNSKVKELF